MNKAGYGLCRQTVTLYHADVAARTVARCVVQGAFLDRRWRENATESGRQAAGSFLLVIPQAHAAWGVDYTLEPGDRVFDGEGPLVGWDDWQGFVPAAVAQLCCVQYVDLKKRRGEPCHLEAGGWWTRSGSGAHSLTN